MSEFGQFCPVALASETLSQKWILLIVRELCAGAARFSDIRRGVPRISATLLKQRLDTLELAGVIERRSLESGRQVYALTEAGEDLRPVVASVGAWGQRWAREIRTEDLDPRWLVWAMHRRLDIAAMPLGRTVIELVFRDAPARQRRFWLVSHNGDVDVCIKPPGFDANVTVRVGLRAMAEIWRGLRPIAGGKSKRAASSWKANPRFVGRFRDGSNSVLSRRSNASADEARRSSAARTRLVLTLRRRRLRRIEGIQHHWRA